MRTEAIEKASLLLCMVPLLHSPIAKAGCEKDTDCKGDRICVSGECVYPSGQDNTAASLDEPSRTEPPLDPNRCTGFASSRIDTVGLGDLTWGESADEIRARISRSQCKRRMEWDADRQAHKMECTGEADGYVAEIKLYFFDSMHGGLGRVYVNYRGIERESQARAIHDDFSEFLGASVVDHAQANDRTLGLCERNSAAWCGEETVEFFWLWISESKETIHVSATYSSSEISTK